MKLSLNWIRDYVAIPDDFDLKKLAFDLTMSTVEVEGAEELARRVKEVPMAKVNLIPLSPVDHRPDFKTPPESTMLMFLDVLMKNRVQTMIRRSRGKESQAACGQLRLRSLPGKTI